jgi:hypothetical protein
MGRGAANRRSIPKAVCCFVVVLYKPVPELGGSLSNRCALILTRTSARP